ncbi:excalibur calcium-binding domain-containing protein [Streptomyces sp. NPDC057509]|uniref:excalibur calcium-binding domain-containing protein n=1 Tax=Streptomyces sp. NPDC057509 TaxID=3346152 RepID=UPI003674A85A
MGGAAQSSGSDAEAAAKSSPAPAVTATVTHTTAPEPAVTETVTASPKPAPTVTKTRTIEVTVAPEDPAGSADDPGSGGGSSPYYANCTAVRTAGAAPIHRGEPGYGRHLDRDGDGVACE